MPAFDFGHFAIEHTRTSRMHIQFAIERLQQGTFTGTHFTDQVNEFPGFRLEIHAFQNDMFFLGDIHILIFDAHICFF